MIIIIIDKLIIITSIHLFFYIFIYFSNIIIIPVYWSRRYNHIFIFTRFRPQFPGIFSKCPAILYPHL